MSKEEWEAAQLHAQFGDESEGGEEEEGEGGGGALEGDNV